MVFIFALVLVISLCSIVSYAQQLHCDASFGSNQYYKVNALVNPFFASDNFDSANSTSIESNLLVSCERDDVEYGNKILQEWRIEICTLRMKQPCPEGSGWSPCSQPFECEDSWAEFENVGYFYLEKSPNPGLVYWDPSEEAKYGQSMESCLAKYSILQQIQGALNSEKPQYKKVSQQSKVEDGVLIQSTRHESVDNPGDFTMPGFSSSAMIYLDRTDSQVCRNARSHEGCAKNRQFSKKTKSKPKKAPSKRNKFPNIDIYPILSPGARCPDIKSYGRQIRREMLHCEDFSLEDKCLEHEDRPFIIKKLIKRLKSNFQLASGKRKLSKMNESMSKLLQFPEGDGIDTALELLLSFGGKIQDNREKAYFQRFMKMIAFNQGLHKIPSAVSYFTRFAYFQDELIRNNALLVLSSLAKQTNTISKALSVDTLSKLPKSLMQDILHNGGSVLKDHLKHNIQENFQQIAVPMDTNLSWNVSIPKFEKEVGIESLLKVAFAIEAFVGVDYETCDGESARGFEYNVQFQSGFDYWVFGKSHKFYEAILKEKNTDSREDYLRFVFKDQVYYDSSIISSECTHFDRELYNHDFKLEIGSTPFFSIGPFAISGSLSATTHVDIHASGNLCTSQASANVTVGPKSSTVFSGDVCLGCIVKACIGPGGGFKVSLLSENYLYVDRCPALHFSPELNLEITESHIDVQGKIQYWSSEHTATLLSHKFDDYRHSFFSQKSRK